jgi:hypothetical protein
VASWLGFSIVLPRDATAHTLYFGGLVSKGGSVRNALYLIWATCCWSVWKEHNNRTFFTFVLWLCLLWGCLIWGGKLADFYFVPTREAIVHARQFRGSLFLGCGVRNALYLIWATCCWLRINQWGVLKWSLGGVVWCEGMIYSVLGDFYVICLWSSFFFWVCMLTRLVDN